MSDFRFFSGYYLALFLGAVVLHVLLAVFAPDPNGYVYDFYSDAIVLAYESGKLPAADDCWVCYHPPLLSLIGVGIFHLVDSLGGARNAQLFAVASFLNGLSLVFAVYCFAIYRHYRRYAAMDLVIWALLLFLPVVFISSFSIEADLLVATAIIAALYYFICFLDRESWSDLILSATCVALAALSKYSGLVVAVFLGGVLLVRWLDALDKFRFRQGVLYALIVCMVGAYPYIKNFREHGTPVVGNRDWNTGISYFQGYDFKSFSIASIIDVFAQPPRIKLNRYPVFNNEVWNSHYGQLWTDFSLFSVEKRHAQRPRGLVYTNKFIPSWFLWGLLVAGLVPVLGSIAGLGILMIQREALLLIGVSALTITIYVDWFLGSNYWMLKTKYLIYLIPLCLVAIERAGRIIPPRFYRLLLLPAAVLSGIYCFFFAIF